MSAEQYRMLQHLERLICRLTRTSAYDTHAAELEAILDALEAIYEQETARR